MRPLASSIIFIIFLTMMNSCSKEAEQMKSPNTQIVYVGTYTSKGSDGIYVYKFNMLNSELTLLHSVKDVENPSFLALDPEKKYLYAVHELNNYKGKRTGSVRSFKIDPQTWNLSYLSEQPSFGEHPCQVTTSREGDFVLLANYTSGSVSLFPTRDGIIQTASDTAQHVGGGPNTNRQKEPHAHSVTLSPDGRFAYAADLGNDKIYIYDLKKEPGKLTPAEQAFVRTAPGAGPRHFAFHPNGRFAYIINELNSTITAFHFQADNGALAEIETVSALPSDFHGESACADIHITPDGAFLYGSNRGHDSIAIFKIDAATGRLNVQGFQSTLGKTPRNFAIDPTGSYLLAANQNSDNIVVFQINKKTGNLSPTGVQAHVSMPVCIKTLIP